MYLVSGYVFPPAMLVTEPLRDGHPARLHAHRSPRQRRERRRVRGDRRRTLFVPGHQERQLELVPVVSLAIRVDHGPGGAVEATAQQARVPRERGGVGEVLGAGSVLADDLAPPGSGMTVPAAPFTPAVPSRASRCFPGH